jgi:hypothetical protein
LKDDEWFLEKRGYSVHDAHAIIKSLLHFQSEKIPLEINKILQKKLEKRTALPCFEFTVEDVEARTNLDAEVIENILNSFTILADDKNDKFTAIHDFNMANVSPIIKSENKFILFQAYDLVESFYESPFYWMYSDMSYKDIAVKNRGYFMEKFLRDKLEKVFGIRNVFPNVNLKRKGNIQCEMDLFVAYVDRAIICTN